MSTTAMDCTGLAVAPPSEHEARREVHGLPSLGARQREAHDVLRPDRPEPQAAAETGVPVIRRLAFEEDASDVREPQQAHIHRKQQRQLSRLHPQLGGLLNIFNEGRLALVQRTGYANSSRSHFEATDIWGTANPRSSTGSGWLGRYLDTLPRPLDALAAWNTTAETPRALLSGQSGVPAIPNASTYTYASPNRGAAALQERAAAQAMAANPANGRPHLAFVNSTSRGAIDTLDRVAQATSYTPTVAYPNNGFALAMRTVAGAIVRGIGSRVFWVQTGGFDTHAGQGATGGAYGNLMGTLGNGLAAFYSDVRNQGLAGDTTVVVFSEFGRRISENGSAGTDHGAAGLTMVLGGSVRGGLHGTAASLAPGSPTLENNSGDVRYETDFRSVYARLLDQWLGVNSVPILNGDFRAGAPAIF